MKVGEEDDRGAYNIKDAAKKLGISRTTLYAMIADNEIRTFTVRGMRRIAVAEIKRIMGPDAPA